MVRDFCRRVLVRLPGVGEVTLLGQYDYVLRVRLDPEKLAAHKLNAAEIVSALGQQNVQVAPIVGTAGPAPTPRGHVFEYVLNTRRGLATPEQFGDIILKVESERRIIRLKDLARIEVGGAWRQRQASFNDKPVAALVVR